MGKRHALLVGIDNYRHNGARHSNAKPVHINDLAGCVNDVTMIADLLRTSFNLSEQTRLTSPPPTAAPSAEDASSLPTYSNISKAFKDIIANASDGDLFFFHFSGHGARLPSTRPSASEHEEDPSLLPMDYGEGQPAIRGWELNSWLEQLYKKHVDIVVSLDSCYSAGAWRDTTSGLLRTPKEWNPPANLDVDKAAVQGLPAVPNHRHHLKSCWGINPTRFTLLAACRESEASMEYTRGTQTHGIFSYELCSYLRSCLEVKSTPSYRCIRDYVAEKVKPQGPQVFGQVRLAFLEQREVFSAASVVGRVEGTDLILPIGRAQGVRTGAIYTSSQASSHIPITIIRVDYLQSYARLEGHCHSPVLEVFPFRWSAEVPLKIHLHNSLGEEFKEKLLQEMGKRITGQISPVQCDREGDGSGLGSNEFRVQPTTDGGIDLFGSAATIGGQGSVRGLRFDDMDAEERATEASVALAHLFRFLQVHDLRSQISPDPPPFAVMVSPGSSPEQPFFSGQMIKYTFKNQSQHNLYLTILNFGPGFHIKQLFPPEDQGLRVEAGSSRSLEINITVPQRLEKSARRDGRPLKDVIRSVVTKGRPLSLKTLELPKIWEASLMKCGGVRDGSIVKDHDFKWWIHDEVTFTKPAA